MTNLIWLLVKPSHLLLYALLVGGAFHRSIAGRRLLTMAVAFAGLVSFVPVGAMLLAPLEARFPRPELPRRVDGIIVLAGAELPELSLIYREPQFDRFTDRLTSFLLLAQRFPEARLIHSGGSTEPARNQSVPARTLILGVGIDARRVLFEDRSRNTCESAQLTFDRAEPTADQRWLLVTSALHMPRAIACFRAVGWDVVAYPTDFKRGPGLIAFSLVNNLSDVDLAVHEWIGLAYYRLRGFTRELFPAP